MHKVEIEKWVSDEAWKAGRQRDVTSTDVAALFGVSPWRSALRVWTEKNYGEQPESSDGKASEAPAIGRALEHAIASYAQGVLGRSLIRYRDYHRLPDVRLGASYDYLDGDGNIVEIKNVGSGSLSGWGDDTMPAHVELQVQAQLICMPTAESVTVFALLGGSRTANYLRRPHSNTQSAILQAVQMFWESKWPPVPGPQDRDAIRLLCAAIRPKATELTGADASLLREMRKAERTAAELPLLKDRVRMLAIKHGASRLRAGKIVVDVGDL